jgi:uncharacterized protein YgbK (DUF1537 family)
MFLYPLQFYQYKVALYKEMYAEKAKEEAEAAAKAKAAVLAGSKRAMTEEEMMQEVTVSKFPSLKGFFRQ